jgi:hypothetical protein
LQVAIDSKNEGGSGMGSLLLLVLRSQIELRHEIQKREMADLFEEGLGSEYQRGDFGVDMKDIVKKKKSKGGNT